MSAVPFSFSLHGSHDDLDSVTEQENITREVFIQIADARPYYEATLYCELDTETGQVRVLRTVLAS